MNSLIRLGLLTLTLFCTIVTSGLGQDCFPDGILLTSQSEIDSFATNYPNCTVIEGDLCIGRCEDASGNDSDITNLDGLSQITHIKGDLHIAYNDFLENIDGLGNVTQIDSNITFRNNDALTSLNGLNKLSRVNGDLYLRGNCTCMQTTGLEQVNTIAGNLYLSFGINNLTGFQNVDSVLGRMSAVNTPSQLRSFAEMSNIKYLGGLSLSSTFIQTLTGLSQLTEVHGDVRFSNNYGLKSLAGFNNVHTIHGDFYLGENDDLGFGSLGNLVEVKGDLSFYRIWYANIDDLTSLERVGGDFSFDYNNLTYEITGPNNLQYIGGRLRLYDNDNYTDVGGFNSLDTIMGNLEIESHYRLESFSGLNSVKHIGGDLRIRSNRELTSFTGLTGLKSLEGTLILYKNEVLEQISLPTNIESLGGLEIEQNDVLTAIPQFPVIGEMEHGFRIYLNPEIQSVTGFNNLQRVGGEFSIESNSGMTTINGFSGLSHIGGDFTLRYNFDLESVSGFERIDSVEGSFIFNNGFSTFDIFTLERLEYVGLNIEMQNINALQDLSVLTPLQQINGELDIGNMVNMTSLSGIEHITVIGGGLRLSRLNAISNLASLSHLDSIGGELSITNLDSLTDLSGLENLKAINGRLEIAYNDRLTSLSGIENLDPGSISSESVWQDDITLIRNEVLSDCSVSTICAALYRPGIKFRIEDNGPGCNSVSEIECTDISLIGNVFYDINQNKVRDSREYGIDGIPISITPPGRTVLTDQQGRFTQACDSGQVYTIGIDPGADWQLTTDSSSYTHNFTPGAPENINNNFGLYPVSIDHNMEVNLSSNQTRCNERVTFYLRYQNTGDFIENGRVILEIDQKADFVSSNPSSSWFLGDRKWDFDSIYPYEYRDIVVTLDMPSESSTGEEMMFTATVMRKSADTLTKAAEYSYHPIVLCSYDPNDKLANPPGYKEEKYILKEYPVTYTVRFQNTGNAPAIDVRILDTIDANLDMSTFKVVNSSFPVQTIVDEHFIEFYFRNIWLPDSLSNEPESHGFVSYEIKPKPGLDDFTLVENTAHIVFDFNPAIVTNTVSSTLVDEICYDTFTTIDSSACQGDTVFGYTQSGIYRDTIQIGSICDSISTLYLYVQQYTEDSLALGACQGNELIIGGIPVVIHNDTTIIDSTFSTAGCLVSATHILISVIVPDTLPIDTTICEGESFHGFTETGIHYLGIENPETGCMDQWEINLVVIPAGEPGCLTSTADPNGETVVVYPNPAQDLLTIRVNNGQLFRADLTDLYGRTLQSTGQDNLDLGELPPGPYLLKVQTSTRSWLIKIIKTAH